VAFEELAFFALAALVALAALPALAALAALTLSARLGQRVTDKHFVHLSFLPSFFNGIGRFFTLNAP